MSTVDKIGRSTVPQSVSLAGVMNIKTIGGDLEGLGRGLRPHKADKESR